MAGHWIPIIGTLHEDSDIIHVSGEHWHIDWRFMPDSLIRHTGCGGAHAIVVWDRWVASEPRWAILKCRRLMPEFPTKCGPGWSIEIPFMRRLETAYADAKLPESLKCPHRGIPLAGVPVVNGMVTCPGHGLQFCVKTGRLVRRVTSS
jgi:hypothetical protein